MRTIVALILLFVGLQSQAQDSMQYVQGFEFKQGIYLNYQQFRSNSPILKSTIVFSEDSSRLDFIKLALSKDNVQWKDTSGKIQTTKVSSLWGYSENNAVYIRFNNQYNRIVVIGSICHFTSYVTNYLYTGPGTYPSQQYGTPVESLQQYILDTDSGTVYDFNTESMEYILQRDAVLSKEFSGLRRKQKKDQLFIYLRRYNERHPLYFKK